MTQRQKSRVLELCKPAKTQKHLRLPFELAERLGEAADELSISGNELVIRAISAYLQKLREPAADRSRDPANGEGLDKLIERFLDLSSVQVRTELTAVVGALAPHLQREIVSGLTELKAEMATVFGARLLELQGQVAELIADSILGFPSPPIGAAAPPNPSLFATLATDPLASSSAPTTSLRTAGLTTGPIGPVRVPTGPSSAKQVPHSQRSGQPDQRTADNDYARRALKALAASQK